MPAAVFSDPTRKLVERETALMEGSVGDDNRLRQRSTAAHLRHCAREPRRRQPSNADDVGSIEAGSTQDEARSGGNAGAGRDRDLEPFGPIDGDPVQPDGGQAGKRSG